MPKRVLLVGSYLSRTGASSRSVGEELALRLAAQGWETTLTSDKIDRAARLADMLGTVWRARHRYDVALVEVYSGLAFTWAEAVCAALRRLRKPVVLALHGGNLPTFAARWPRRVARFLRKAERVVAPSPYLRETLRGHRPDIDLIPNGLELAAYPYRERVPARPKLVWLRAYHALYRPWDAVEALALLRRTQPEATLLMVGPDKGDGSLARTRELTGRLGLAEHVTFAGPVAKAEVPARLNEGDVFLNTTSVDNTPVSVLEALACGLLVATTNVGGLPYLLEHERDALLVPPADPAALALVVQRVLEDEGLARRLSARGHALAAQNDWATVLARWEAVLTAR